MLSLSITGVVYILVGDGANDFGSEPLTLFQRFMAFAFLSLIIFAMYAIGESGLLQ